MSIDDGLVMQLHVGSIRGHNALVRERFGNDKGADIPTTSEFTHNLRPLLEAYGNDPRLTLILFTLDETTYAASWRRWPATTPRSGWARPGGSTTAPTACAATSTR